MTLTRQRAVPLLALLSLLLSLAAPPSVALGAQSNGLSVGGTAEPGDDATPNPTNTCWKLDGWSAGEHQINSGTSYDWGTASWSGNSMTISIGAGYVLDVCVKIGVGGDGAAPGGLYTYSGVSGSGSLPLGGESGVAGGQYPAGISHVGVRVVQEPDPDDDPDGELKVTKTVTGDTEVINTTIDLQVRCSQGDSTVVGSSEGDLSLDYLVDFTDGVWSTTYSDLPDGVTCSVTETKNGFDPDADGADEGVTVTTTINGAATSSVQNIAIEGDKTATVAVVNDYDLDEPKEPDFEIEVDKVVTGNTAPAGAEYKICITPVADLNIALAEVAADDCVLLEDGESHTFEDLWAGPWRVYEVAPDGPLHATLLSVTYSGDGQTVTDPDGRVVTLDEQDPTASVTVTNAYEDDTPPPPPPPPPPPGPDPVGSSVTVTKVWNVDGASPTVGFVPEFTVTLGDLAPQTIAAGGVAAFTGLTAGTSYSLSVVEEPVPSAAELFGEESDCEFIRSAVDGPDRLTAPDRVEIVVTNFYTCETAVLEEVEEEEEPVVEDAEEEEEERLPEPAPEVARTAVEMPRTGVSALFLALLGLFSMGLGGSMVSRRERE